MPRQFRTIKTTIRSRRQTGVHLLVSSKNWEKVNTKLSDIEYSNETRESHDSGIQFTEIPSDCDSTSIVSF